MKLMDKLVPDSKIYACMSLFPGKSSEEVRRNLLADLKKRMLKFLPVILLLPVLFALSDHLKKEETPAIHREDVNGEAIEIPVVLTNGSETHEVLLKLNPVAMSDAEIDEMQKEIEPVLDKLVLGENPSFNEVSSDLFFAEEVEGFPVLVSWSTSDPGIIGTDGKIRPEDEERTALICGKVYYGEEFRLYERLVTVTPPQFTPAEEEFRLLIRELQAYEKQTGYDREFVLPEDVNGARVDLVSKKKLPSVGLGVFFGLLLGIGAWSNFFGSLNEKRKKRLSEAESDCKDFLSKLSILLAAGLPLRGAWKKMTEDLEREGRKTMLSENMAVTVREFMNGCPESIAYERFGERMELTRYQRVAAVLSQAVTKGVSELPELLSAEIREAVADEKEQIKIRGEQAGTKLLMPMMGFLVIVFAILLVPAFISF
ncbi:MAG: type II secretion system F family protein, partial [Lachnospiraceae bacterium]|nr:type II secretion system F family protein [Lachnospiraceae bacterium]